MAKTVKRVCPVCGSTRIGWGNVNILNALRPYGKLYGGGSALVAYVCSECGHVLEWRALHPEKFDPEANHQDQVIARNQSRLSRKARSAAQREEMEAALEQSDELAAAAKESGAAEAADVGPEQLPGAAPALKKKKKK